MSRKKPARAPEFDRASRAVPASMFEGQRVRFSLRTTNKREVASRRQEIEKLWTWRAWDVLHGIATGALDVGNVAAAVKQHGEAALLELRKEAIAKAHGGVPTVRQEADAYLAHYERGRRQEHSEKQIRSRLKVFCEQEVEGVLIGSVPLPALTAKAVGAAIDGHWKASATREAIRLAVSGLYTWSIEEERQRAKAKGHAPRWDENPAAAVEPYERRAREVTAATVQAVALLQAAEIHQAAYLRAFLHLGLREDELIHTRLHLDLDADTWIWRIQGRGPDDRHGCIQCQKRGWTPKNKRSTRTLLVPETPSGLREAITDYIETYPCEPGDFVFRNPRTGAPWDAGRLDADFKALCKRAGVTYGRKVPGGITLHDLRATCATRLVQAKERESVIAALLGDTVQTIVTSYVRLTSDDLANAVSRGPRYETEEG